MKNLLMCDPSFYQIDYEINPWMSVLKKANSNLAAQQWNDLVSLIEKVGAKVHKMNPITGLPDIVFTANAAIVFQDIVLLSNFKYAERKGEKKHYKEWFDAHSYRTFELPESLIFEGAGDVLFGEEGYIFFGSGFRSEENAYQYNIWDAIFNLKFKSIPLKLVDPYFYHLDTCFCPLKGKQILIHSPAFEKESLEMLKSRFDLIEVPKNDAANFACNAVLIENNIIIPSNCEETKNLLQGNGYEVHETNMSEFILAGGACRCLTLVI